ncbi:6-phosphogluconolactonase [Thalassotalea mangrovi]|uniref:6-phosphogluconolactonase n=1 Tax=Thalassotalea mangrovi TaxID=2572245 RepID=A0A4U1B471_9GAMM|nr:6-phosphogluconolactonase [Thalassotalea mangrovi]TKB44834.1 6-phosphogluconolactonase [Thalassotalea mangrovi]
MFNKHIFASRPELDQAFAEQVAAQLQSLIEKNGKASIAFSGGSTPKGFFAALSVQDIAWDKVTVTLADERWVEYEDNNSNTRLLTENLLTNNAKVARLFSLKRDGALDADNLAKLNQDANDGLLPLDIVILGMGEDGHTASLFPCSAEIEQGLDQQAAPGLLKVVPTSAPFERISFNFSALIQASHLYLHLVGDNKMAVLDQAISSKDSMQMPIRAFLHHDVKTVDIFWAE